MECRHLFSISLDQWFGAIFLHALQSIDNTGGFESKFKDWRRMGCVKVPI